MLTLERSFSNKDLKDLRKLYTMPFPKKPHKETGLLVIQSNTRTAGNQRKRSVLNWKVSILFNQLQNK